MQFMLARLKTLMIPRQPPAASTGRPVSLSQLQAVLGGKCVSVSQYKLFIKFNNFPLEKYELNPPESVKTFFKRQFST